MHTRDEAHGKIDGIHEVNMTPLIDVALVLVIILMVATPLAFQSSMPPVWQMSRPAASSRGPGMAPRLMASRIWISTMCSAPADSPAVQPQSSIVLALQTAAIVATSGGCFRSRSGRSRMWL